MSGARVSGFILLFLGVILLSLTFIIAIQNAYGSAAVVMKGGFTEVLGESFGILLNTCVKAIYLGVMGWVGSIITSRGVELLRAEGGEQSKGAAREKGSGASS